jgi:hypothetical protein
MLGVAERSGLPQEQRHAMSEVYRRAEKEYVRCADWLDFLKLKKYDAPMVYFYMKEKHADKKAMNYIERHRKEGTR